MEFSILGPVEVRGEFGAVALRGLKPRAVLAVLLLNANQPVSPERLAVALWGEDAPSGATRTVQVYVSRLRKALGDPEAITTTPAGYRLRVGPGELDVDRFERGVAAGRLALGAGEPERAVVLLQEALALWRGPPLAGLEFEPFAQAEIARLEEQRLAALEARVDADLAAGRHALVVSELRQSVAAHPARERLAGKLMLALYRSGRQSEALEVFHDVRAGLVEASGVEPGPDLQRLQLAILGQDVSLQLQPATPELPRELSSDGAPPLVGRGAELDRLRAHWKSAGIGRGRLVAVLGSEGMGKTRLVAELAGEVHRAGAVVWYVSGGGPHADVLRVFGEVKDAARAMLVVVDDADRGGDELAAALARLAEILTRLPVLVVATGRDADAVARAAHDAIVLDALDAAAVRAIAADQDVPAEALRAAGGVPRLVHQVARRWVRREVARRVGTVAERTAAGRADLQSMQAELTGGVIELQATDEFAELADTGGGRVRCPFKGLASFDVDDAPYFFGRERLVAELVARMVGAPLLGVVGPSGSGKSSVVRAGLLPALAGGVLPASETWARVLMRPGDHPLRELETATAGLGPEDAVVVVVDQFEETFTACRDEPERAAFIAQLSAARAARTVVLAIRADHYGRCAAYPELSRLLADHHVLVGAMRRDELRRAVERPALRVGLAVEPELTDALVGDVEHEPGALPMLSTALLELWQRRDGRRLRLTTYEATGGVRGAVGRHAEEAFGRLDREQQAVARSVLLRLAAEAAGGVIERRRVALAELDEDHAEVVAVLTDQRLLTVSSGAVELAHEALLREWPRLRGWLEEDAEGRRLHRRLADAAREWHKSGRDTGDLYRGARLAAALEWRARHESDLNRVERAYLDAAHSAEQRELHAVRDRRRRAVTLAGLVLVVITGISMILAVRGIQRARFEQRAAASRALATRALTRLSDNVALAALLGLEAYRREPTIEARSAVLAVLPSLAAYRRIGRPLEHGAGVQGVAISPDGRMLASAGDDGNIWLWDVTARRRLGRPLKSHDGGVTDVAFSPDGALLASAGDNGTASLWDVATHRRLGRPLQLHVQTMSGVAFSPDGETLATAGGGALGASGTGQEGVVQLWDVATRRSHGRPLVTAAERVNDVEFSPDGMLLAIAADTELRLWDVASGRPLGRPLSGSNQIYDVAFSPDGKILAGALYDTTVRLWDVRARRPSGRPLNGHASEVRTVSFSPDGRTLASGSQDATVRLWNVATRRTIRVLVADTDLPADRTGAGRVASVFGVAFSPRGGLLASAGEQGTVQLWDVDGEHSLSRPLPGRQAWVRSVAFAPDGALASAALDGTVQLWGVHGRRPLGRALQSPGPALAVAASPDGRTLAVAGAGTGAALRIWDAHSHRPNGSPLDGHAGTVKAVAFSPNGEMLASGGEDGTVRLWDADNRQPLGPPLDARAGAVNGVAFGRDGELLAAAGQDGAVRLWDVGDHRRLDPPLRGPTGFVSAVAFTPDGQILASTNRDGSVSLWDVDHRRPLGPPLTGHADVVTAVAFSPDGRTLASTSADHTLRLWDVRTRRALGRPLEGRQGWMSAVAFSPRGDGLASAGEDGTVRLWDPVLWSDDSRALTNRICGTIRRSLTHAEWAEFLPGPAVSPDLPRITLTAPRQAAHRRTLDAQVLEAARDGSDQRAKRG